MTGEVFPGSVLHARGARAAMRAPKHGPAARSFFPGPPSGLMARSFSRPRRGPRRIIALALLLAGGLLFVGYALALMT
jgi:hypothetical protein